MVSTDIFNLICTISDTPSAEILLSKLKAELGIQASDRLIGDYFIHSGNRQDISFSNDNERSYPVEKHDGVMSYFSSDSAKWIRVNSDDLSVYKINHERFLRLIMDRLDISERTNPQIILDENIWFIGSARLKKRTTPVIFVRNITNQAVAERLNSYLKEKHRSDPALILTTANNIPAYFQLYGQSRVVLLNEPVNYESKELAFNMTYLADKMGDKSQTHGFNNGYRTAYIDGVQYSFTKLQAEVIEVLDSANGPMYKHELMSKTNSTQDDPKGIFRKNGKYNAAWNVIIKFDTEGNYWLEY